MVPALRMPIKRSKYGAVLAALATLAALGACVRYYRLELQGERPLPPGLKPDVILVPGQELTAQGEAIPLLHNRVLQAVRLWERGVAPRLLVSGGKPRAGITEAEKMRDLAIAAGVPPECVVLETAATTSQENAIYAARIMLKRRWRTALVVTDAHHILYAMPVFQDAFNARDLNLYWTAVDPASLRKDPRWMGPETASR